MLSAVFSVFVGFLLAVVRSYRRNGRELAAGRGGYQPPQGLIRWSDAHADGTGDGV